MSNERHERTRKLGSTFANLLMAAGGLGLARKLGAKRTARVVRLVIADRLRQRHHAHGHQAHRSWRSKHA